LSVFFVSGTTFAEFLTSEVEDEDTWENTEHDKKTRASISPEINVFFIKLELVRI
jgi:hypothetical protein